VIKIAQISSVNSFNFRVIAAHKFSRHLRRGVPAR
jgi:hypothetical protein